MGKLLFWAFVIVGAMIALRLWNLAQLRQQRRQQHNDAPSSSSRSADSSQNAPMVRCVRCGVFLPRSDARMSHDGYRCSDEACNRHA